MENAIKVIEIIVENITLFIALMCCLVVAIQKISEFIALPNEKRMKEVKIILLEWVRQAEADLGSGTGKFKLAQVYEKFCTAYPYLKKWFPIEKFELLVQNALSEMEKSFENQTVKDNALKLQ